MLEDELKEQWALMKETILSDAMKRGLTTKINGEECLVIHGFGDDPHGTCVYGSSQGEFYVKSDYDGRFSVEKGFTDVKYLEIFPDLVEAMNYALSSADFRD